MEGGSGQLGPTGLDGARHQCAQDSPLMAPFYEAMCQGHGPGAVEGAAARRTYPSCPDTVLPGTTAVPVAAGCRPVLATAAPARGTAGTETFR
jgi:hypothetical protein